jgi:hypothetical protein
MPSLGSVRIPYGEEPSNWFKKFTMNYFTVVKVSNEFSASHKYLKG